MFLLCDVLAKSKNRIVSRLMHNCGGMLTQNKPVATPKSVPKLALAFFLFFGFSFVFLVFWPTFEIGRLETGFLGFLVFLNFCCFLAFDFRVRMPSKKKQEKNKKKTKKQKKNSRYTKIGLVFFGVSTPHCAYSFIV